MSAADEPELPFLTLEERLEKAIADHQQWTRVAANPSLSPRAAAVAQSMARSCGAAVTLGKKALAYRDQNSDVALLRKLGMAGFPKDQLQPAELGRGLPSTVLSRPISPPLKPQ